MQSAETDDSRSRDPKLPGQKRGDASDLPRHRSVLLPPAPTCARCHTHLVSEEAGTPLPREALVGALVKELTDARRRGLDRMDLDTGQWKAAGRTEAPELERLAREYTGDHESSRVALIRDLMSAALKEWRKQRNEDNAAFVRDLFFAEDGRTPGRRSPTELADKVRKQWNIHGKPFEERREAIFSLFARFAIEFVEAKPEEPQQAEPVHRRSPGTELTRADLSSNKRGWPTTCALVAVAVLIGAIVWLGARSDDSRDPGAFADGGSTRTDEPQPITAPFTFDALGGGSSIINVYPGVRDTASDKLANGTFADGQLTTAVCKTTGRRVRSDPSVGEKPRESNVWVKVVAQPGKTSYAPLSYGRMEQNALKALPECA